MGKMKAEAVILVLFSAGLLHACTGSPASQKARAATQTAQAIDDIAAQTLEALRTVVESGSEKSAAPAATNTLLPATSTPLPTATAWPDPVWIRVSVDTNCRSGPGPPFPLVGALMVGETTLVRARSIELNYWIVDNPDNPGRECWLWGKHATPDGAREHLPQAAAPATPTPAPAMLAGWVYFDANNNGVRGDPGDGPIDGARLTLRVGTCPGGLTVAVVETDSRGRYLIPSLIPTQYCLSRDPSLQLLPNTWSVNLSPGQFRDEVNFRRIP
jgi:hypothetical protein